MQVIPHTPWIYPEQQPEVVMDLLNYGLIKYDNRRGLPLKMGGTTDIYLTLRDARGKPSAIPAVASLYSDALRRLPINNFVEVPDSVSCFAGHIANFTGLPYFTVREQEKTARVSNPKVVTPPHPGTRTAIIDDVITNGASKIPVYRLCPSLGVTPYILVVLVDRQQGWRQKFTQEGINLPVWPGLTLHDVRKHLIQTFGVMRRCDPEAEAKNKIILALDGKDWEEILPIIDPLRTTGCIFKVNDLMFEEGFKHLVPDLSVYGRVMVDLKCHDIPNTVTNTCRRLREHHPWAVTIHASGGPDMIRAAVKAFEGTDTKILAVTVLTSIDPTTCEEIYHRLPWDQVKALADLAQKAGTHGLVCSPEEVGPLRQFYSPDRFPNFILVTPGIRSVGKDAGDQKRTGTPAEAVKDGADYLVMGRQIMEAPDPVAEYHRVMTEELGIH